MLIFIKLESYGLVLSQWRYQGFRSSKRGGNGFARDVLAGISATFADPFHHHFSTYLLRCMTISLEQLPPSFLKSMSSAVQTLTEYRKQGVRRSQETYTLSKQIYGTRHERAFGEEKWAFYEQFAIAALDVGDSNQAEELLLRLAEKFPLSPRVSAVEGMLLESKREFGLAERLYTSLLEEDPTNIAIQKRMIVLTKLLYPKDPSKALNRLTAYLDTFYSDPEAWMELADMYTAQQSYQRALFAIEECLLMQPINPFYVLKYAETQYTTGDIHEAYKSYLRVVELQDSFARAWLGLKMCCRRLLQYPTNEQPEHLARVDVLATQKSLDVYTSSSSHKVDDDSRRAVLKFVE